MRQVHSTCQDVQVMNIRESGIPVVSSISLRERNWGGPDAMWRFMRGVADHCISFPDPHGWEAGAVVAEALGELRRRSRRD